MLITAALIIIGVLLFELIIFFHEGGHFVTAKLSGVKVNEFALGMGPKLFSFTKGETKYSLRLLPIGGYCAMEGEDEESDNPRAFNNVKIYKRLIIVAAGAVMNIVLGLILMMVLLLPMENFSSTTVNSFIPQSYSANSGLEEGDKIIAVDGYAVNNSLDLSYSLATIKVQDVSGDSFQIYKQDCTNALSDIYYDQYEKGNFDSFTDAEYEQIYADLCQAAEKVNAANTKEEADLALSEGAEVLYSYFPSETVEVPTIEVKDSRPRFRADLKVVRSGEEVLLEDVDFRTYTTADDPTPKMSIDFYTNPKDKTFLSLLEETGSQTVSVVRMVVDSLIGLVKGEFGFTDVSGPIGAASATVEVAQQGLKTGFGDAVLNIVYVMMIISVNLGVVNMLPFPALDGGRFLFLLIEGIFRRPIPRKVEAIVNAIGLGILLIFILIVSVKDVWMLFV
ncbi:MAG: RIP metalloprotease RseP [Clostridia bacterium]|nr:RIP metalloprotease RseP [Clostridia bacterium]